MPLSHLVAAPVAIVSMTLQTPVEIQTLTFPVVEDQSREFADALVTAYACELLGYQVDYDGLADYGYEVRDNFVAFGLDPSQAMERMQRDVRQRRARFNTYEGRFIAGPIREFSSLGYSPQAKFRHRFTRLCSKLTASQTVGFYITEPEERANLQELNAALLALQARNSVNR